MARVAVTGATGYLGSAVVRRLDAAGHSVLALSRHRPLDTEWRRYDLSERPQPELLDGVDVLVHCAYDLAQTAWSDIHRINVEGFRRLLDLATGRGVRCQLVSSMSAYPGTRQLYGRAKLACEAAVLDCGGNAVRPGLVYGSAPGGMVATLMQLTRLPVLPVIGAKSHQFTVHVDDAGLALLGLVEDQSVAGVVAGLAHPLPVRFDDLIAGLATASGRRTRILPIPWRPVYEAMRLAERSGVTLPLRADSVLGLVRPARSVINVELWDALGVRLRPWPTAVRP